MNITLRYEQEYYTTKIKHPYAVATVGLVRIGIIWFVVGSKSPPLLAYPVLT